jgi:preprotein translocase subunit SecG
MAKRLTITMTNRRLYIMLAISIILILSGIMLNRMPSSSTSITGMVQNRGFEGPLSDAEWVAAGFLIIAVLCLYVVFIAKNKKI